MILLLSRSVPPKISGTSSIVLNLAKNFNRHNMVLVGAFEPNCPLNSLSDEFPEIKYVSRTFNIRGARWLHWLQAPIIFFQTLYLALIKNCKAFIILYPNEIHLFVGYLVGLILKIPIFPYFHNAYTGTYPSSIFASWLEKKVLSLAEHTFFISDGLKEAYSNKYKNFSFSTLEHTHNENPPTLASKKKINYPIRILFSGTINLTCFDAFQSFTELIKSNENYQLDIYTGTSEVYLKNNGITSDDYNIAKVSRDKLMQKIKDADILFLPHSFNDPFPEIERQTIFPTKTIEYLLSGVPILAYIPKGCFLWRFLKEKRCAYIVDSLSTRKLNEAIELLKNDDKLRIDLIKNAARASRLFESKRIIDNLKNSSLKKYL